MPTNEEIIERRELWAAALESNKYQQTTGRLRNENGYCCLGVLCDISGLGKWVTPYDLGGAYKYKTYESPSIFTGSTATLPPEVTKWIGISNDGGIVKLSIPVMMNDHLNHSLVDLNDWGVSFAEIAAVIRTLPLPPTQEEVLDDNRVPEGN